VSTPSVKIHALDPSTKSSEYSPIKHHFRIQMKRRNAASLFGSFIFNHSIPVLFYLVKKDQVFLSRKELRPSPAGTEEGLLRLLIDGRLRLHQSGLPTRYSSLIVDIPFLNRATRASLALSNFKVT